MFENVKKGLYFSREKLLFEKGIREGSIQPFDDSFYEGLSTTYIGGLPVSMHIKYLNPISGEGKCYDRSLYMFFCFDNAVLVRGDNKDLELRYGKENAGHGWIEMDGYCYDPSLLLRFKKETYYEMYKPCNISKTTSAEYKNCCLSNKQLYEDIVNTKLSDFQPNGSRRVELCTIIPLVREIAEKKTDTDLKKELDNYLKLVQYDEKQIYERLHQTLQKKLSKRTKD